MKEKLNVILGLGIVLLVIYTFILYLYLKNTIELFDLITIIIISILVISSSYIILDRLKNIKKGLPTQDERLKIANYKAGSYGFIAAIWSAVGVNMGHIILFDSELRGGLVTAAVVLISGIVYILSYFYLLRKGY